MALGDILIFILSVLAYARPVERDAGQSSPLRRTSNLARVATGHKVPFTYEGYSLLPVGTIQVGTPALDIAVIFSTGSADSWVLDSVYSRSQSLGKHCKDGVYKLQFGDRSGIQGHICTDTDIAVHEQALLSATNVDKGTWRMDIPGDGMLALSSPSVSRLKGRPVGYFWNAVEQKAVTTPGEFSFYFAPRGSTAGSELQIGGRDPSKYIGEPEKHLTAFVGEERSWTIPGGSIYVDGKAVVQDIVTTIDSAANYIYCSLGALTFFYRRVPGACVIKPGVWGIPCAKDGGRPSIEVSWDNMSKFDISEFILYSRVTVDGECVWESEIMLLKDDRAANHWNFGTAFMRAAYTIFSVDQRVILLAKPNHDHGQSP
ncbi:aspartic peptidase domain-containing protein [Rhodofomes roseus]|uniref:Aspartic peptidase domain-containing protein n=1 Tax=Rhodofomes roseus TaxID=34475 RepID=A0ABQ8K4R6_9APHY|nr:aspartic peptidase domain-containing protein [Rhodofomes roseus]KAH9831865.1 aspartic peptidase domain-containing protein [Rhodofomes roseus]